jgi:hypothetical protein
MFEEFGPTNPPLPPAGALEQAMTRGRKIRRQRRASIASGLALSAVLIGGLALANPLSTDKAFVVPAKTTAPTDYSAIPATTSDEPGLDFGKLSKITTAADGTITLHVDREKFYLGEEAVAHNKGKIPLGDYIQEDLDGDQELSFTLDPKASIRVTARLSSNGEQVEAPETLTPQQLIANLDKLDLPAAPDPDTDGRPLLWMRHTGGGNGPVSAIADQFVP